MHFEILVEEPSAESALKEIIPKILGDAATFKIHAHPDKVDLLRSLPGRLKGYAQWLPAETCIVVLVDEDRGDCRALKDEIERAAGAAGLTTKSRAPAQAAFQVLTRIAVEELEAWFFGDTEAIVAAYPGVPPTLAARAKYRFPDGIAGGTWEALERVLQKAGYHKGGLAKIQAARDISRHLRPERNTSKSFRTFREGVLAAAARQRAQPAR